MTSRENYFPPTLPPSICLCLPLPLPTSLTSSSLPPALVPSSLPFPLFPSLLSSLLLPTIYGNVLPISVVPCRSPPLGLRDIDNCNQTCDAHQQVLEVLREEEALVWEGLDQGSPVEGVSLGWN